MFNKISVVLLAIAFTFGFLGPIVALAATSPSLGTVNPFAILSSTLTNSLGITGVTGNVGYTTLSGGGSNTITGTTYTPAPPQTGLDQSTALADLNAQVLASCNSLGGSAVNLDNAPGHTTGIYTPGCYSSGGAMNITTNTVVTLDGGGNSNSVFIFKSAGALTTQASTTVQLINGASACNVFWIPVGATTLGANPTATTTPTFVGNIFRGDSAGLSITLGHFANVLGRLLAFGSTVTTDTNTITAPSCGAPAPGNLYIVKNVVGGTATSSDFLIHVKLAGNEVAGSPLAGTTTPGTLYLLSANTYSISEDSATSYVSTYGTDCSADGNVVLPVGGNKTCTITNTYVAPVVVSSGSSSGGGGGGGGTHYGCKDPGASNYETFAASNPAMCLYTTTASSTTASSTTVYKFPNTGIDNTTDLTQSEAISAFQRSLNVGSQGKDVVVLQTVLVQKGFLEIPSGVAKGYFGGLTRTAIMKYQTHSNLPSVGVFGPLTKAKLISELSK